MNILIKKSEVLLDKIILIIFYLLFLIKASLTDNIFWFVLNAILIIWNVYNILKIANKPEIKE